MTSLEAIVLGAVEGITEFLPISSTFHLIWISRVLALTQSDFQKLFEVVIQSGAILAVIVLFVHSLKEEPALLKKAFVAFLPTAVVGFVMYNLIKDIFFENAILQLTVFGGMGIFFILFERSRRRVSLTRLASSLSYTEALWVGLAQSLAVVPGISRAGATILPLLYFGLRRDEAARVSFLTAIPTILAASLFDLYQTRRLLTFSQDEVVALALGFLAAFAVALFVMKWLIHYLKHHTLAAFGWYRLILAAALALILFL